ncbi:hypothetical protein [Flaviramulus basaltis]|nr:hypothetical protein [Flaviramulus basaltis]
MYILFLFFYGLNISFGQEEWKFTNGVVEGNQFDVVSFKNKLYIIAAHYYELDTLGNIVFEDNKIEDLRQKPMDYEPAIGVSKNGTVHTLTREGGSWNEGHILNYSKKDSTDNWLIRNMQFSEPVKRNYVVGIAALDNGDAYLVHTDPTGQEDIHNLFSFYEATPKGIQGLGKFETSYSRLDANFQMRYNNGKVYLLSGNPWPNGSIWYFNALVGTDFINQLEASKKDISQGIGRKSNPDITFNEDGTGIYSYGSFQSVYYNLIKKGNRLYTKDRLLFSDLGEWHLSSGLSAVSSLSGGEIIMAIALKSRPDLCNDDESCKAKMNIGEIVYKYSIDGGVHWTDTRSTQKYTNAGEGRSIPKLVAINNTFYLFYSDKGKLDMGKFSIPND